MSSRFSLIFKEDSSLTPFHFLFCRSLSWVLSFQALPPLIPNILSFRHFVCQSVLHPLFYLSIALVDWVLLKIFRISFSWRRWVKSLVMNFIFNLLYNFLEVSSPIVSCSQISNCFVNLQLCSSQTFVVRASQPKQTSLCEKGLVFFKKPFFFWVGVVQFRQFSNSDYFSIYQGEEKRTSNVVLHLCLGFLSLFSFMSSIFFFSILSAKFC